jgi:hypothetical protein
MMTKASSALLPGHEDSLPPRENGLLGTPRRPGLHLRQWVAPSSTRLSPITPLRQFHLHFFGNGGIQLHLAMAGNYPRIPGITLGLGLVHYPLLSATHRLALLVQSGRSAPPPRLPVAERRTTCPSSDGSTYGQDGPCSEDRRDFQSPWTTPMEGPTTREPEGSSASTALRSYH